MLKNDPGHGKGFVIGLGSRGKAQARSIIDKVYHKLVIFYKFNSKECKIFLSSYQQRKSFIVTEGGIQNQQTHLEL